MMKIFRNKKGVSSFIHLLFLPVVTLLIIGTFSDFSYACGCDGTIFEGQTKIEVLKRCGEPTFVPSSEELYIKNGDEVWKTNVETWTYNYGSQCFILELTFRGNMLYHIRKEGYGF